MAKPRRTAGSRPRRESLAAALRSNGGLVAPPTDPELDLEAFDAGEPLVLYGWRKEGSRRRNGVLVLNESSPGSIAWHRGSPRRYAASGRLLHTPIELEEFRWLSDTSVWRSRPYLFEVRLRAAGEPWTLWVHIWDLVLFCAATGIVPPVDGDADEYGGRPVA
jgi:hypothetical protein